MWLTQTGTILSRAVGKTSSLSMAYSPQNAVPTNMPMGKARLAKRKSSRRAILPLIGFLLLPMKSLTRQTRKNPSCTQRFQKVRNFHGPPNLSTKAMTGLASTMALGTGFRVSCLKMATPKLAAAARCKRVPTTRVTGPPEEVIIFLVECLVMWLNYLLQILNGVFFTL